MPRRALRNSHQTTIRFPKEMWIELEQAAARAGASVAQYVRDAARARLEGERAAAPDMRAAERAIRDVERVDAIEHSLEHGENSAALWEQGRLARERARLLRAESETRRRHVSQ
jgi:predicted DNA-binding protein